ncbi:MAG: PKD domain-containing protein [Chitinophagales bacterium]
MGMWHWTNGMPAAELIDTEIDWVNDDCADDPFAGIGAYYYNYRSAAVASSPGSAWDPLTGRIYLIYALKIEYTDIYDDPTNFSAESFHDLFGMYSDDDGATWSQPVNLTNNADEEVENYFVFTADRVANGKVHIVWQQDDMPGHFNEGDPITTNNIRYAGLDPESFIPVMPDANFSSVADIGDVTFTNLSTNASGCYFWDFGDGGTSNEANPEYTYTVAGTYSVCLTASNPYGTDTYCDDVIVALPPDAAFTYSGDPIVNFTDLTLNDPTSWSWDFGDGGSSTLQNPVHTFTADATYTVCLTATNALGFEVYCLPIVIDSVALLAPTADFSFTISGLTMSFTDLSTNDPDTWAWDFGDGGTSTEQNPSHAFPVQANYTVCLTASNAYGGDTYCIDDVFANGIHDMQIEEVEIYPNPSTGAVQIALPVLDIDAVNVYDIAGKQMSVNYNVATGNVFLHAEQLAQGTYFVRIYAGDKMYIGNLVKQ